MVAGDTRISGPWAFLVSFSFGQTVARGFDVPHRGNGDLQPQGGRLYKELNSCCHRALSHLSCSLRSMVHLLSQVSKLAVKVGT